MKKLLLVLTCMVLLTACASQSSYDVKISDDHTLLTVGDCKISKQGYFEHLLDSYGASSIVSEALVKIAELELDDQKALDALVKDRIDVYDYYAEGDLEEFAKSLGYAGKQDFIDNALIPDAKQELLRNKYIEANFDQIISDYQVARIKMIPFEKESEALSFIETVTSVSVFDAKMDDVKDSEDYDIVNKNTSLDKNIIALLGEFNQLKEDGIYKSAIKLTDGSYVAIYVYDTARKDHKEYIESLTIEPDLQTEIEGYYLKKYNFDVYDTKLKADIKTLSEHYID